MINKGKFARDKRWSSYVNKIKTLTSGKLNSIQVKDGSLFRKPLLTPLPLTILEQT